VHPVHNFFNQILRMSACGRLIPKTEVGQAGRAALRPTSVFGLMGAERLPPNPCRSKAAAFTAHHLSGWFAARTLRCPSRGGMSDCRVPTSLRRRAKGFPRAVEAPNRAAGRFDRAAGSFRRAVEPFDRPAEAFHRTVKPCRRTLSSRPSTRRLSA
jgi:hypothetical protein